MTLTTVNTTVLYCDLELSSHQFWTSSITVCV